MVFTIIIIIILKKLSCRILIFTVFHTTQFWEHHVKELFWIWKESFQIVIFWDTMLCIMMDGYQCFGGGQRQVSLKYVYEPNLTSMGSHSIRSYNLDTCCHKNLFQKIPIARTHFLIFIKNWTLTGTLLPILKH
jgi:hypothetical protein